MGHVPKGLDYRPSANHPAAKKHATSHDGDVGAAAHDDDGDGDSITLGGDHKHCHEEGCTKAPSYGWASASGEETSVAIMCAKVKMRNAIKIHALIVPSLVIT